MAVIHITEAEAARDFMAIMDRVRAGAEVVIDKDASAVAILRPAFNPNLRRLSESLKLARAHASTVTLDGDFGRDLTELAEAYAASAAMNLELATAFKHVDQEGN